MLWIVFAIVFLFSLFVLKSPSLFKNTKTYQRTGEENLLKYGDLTFEDLVNKDADGDKVPDWQELLYGLDPTKKETTEGTPDEIAIEKISADGGVALGEEGVELSAENLTRTDKFSRELFATIATLNQNGKIDQDTIDQLGNSLSEEIQNSVPRKVFLIFEIKTISDSSVEALKNYNKALSNIYKKNPVMNYTILDVLQKFIADENNIDVSALSKLDPIIEQTNKVIEGMTEMSVPQSIATLHLNVINSQQRLLENITDIKLYDTDAIVALGGISKYGENAAKLESDLNSLADTINQKLGN